MKCLIIYKSKYGATKQYAEWLGEELGIPLATTDEVSPQKLAGYDCLVLGSAVYIGKMIISQWLKKNKAILRNKKLFLFIVCGTNPKNKLKLHSFVQASVPAEFRNQCELCFLLGRINYQKLSWFHKFIISLGARLAKTPEDKAMFRPFDYVEKKNILPLVNSIERYLLRKSKPVALN